MTPHATLRASDADRDAVAERLRKAAVEGRLEPDELEQRLDAALRARTYGQLDRLLADLPSDARPRRAVARTTRTALGVAIPIAVALVTVVAIAAVVVVAAAGWMVWALIWLLVMASRRGGCARRRHHSGPHRVQHRTHPARLV
jgi:uncharacterized protein DUF1707